MRSKYYLSASVLIINLLLLSSCLNSSDDEMESSPDAQIYAFSISSKADTAGLLPETQFTIDQVNGRIFNKEPLPFQFHVDSILVNISAQSSYNSFSQVLINLLPDSTYFWRESDSVSVDRLNEITTYAPDGITKKTYRFELNIYQQDPYILNWEHMANGYLPSEEIATAQQTVVFNDLFITYYSTGTTIEAVTSPAADGTAWSVTTPSGLPHTVELSSLTASDNALYLLDKTTESIYGSDDGVSWDLITTPYPVQALYGRLPSATAGDLLVVVNHDGSAMFAETSDFSNMTLMNSTPEGIPVEEFSATTIDAPSSYAIKYILLSGGVQEDASPNNEIWILQEKDGIITHIISRVPEMAILDGSTLFYYDDKPYLMTAAAGQNRLFYSDNSGLDWMMAGDNQQLPDNFDQRTAASVITDADNYIWIFGGVSETYGQLVDVWRGRLNKFTAM